MFHFFIGTKAQLIKLAPLMLELDMRAIEYNFIDSGQHSETTSILRKQFNLKDPDFTIYTGNDIASYFQALFWALKNFLLILTPRNRLCNSVFGNNPGACIIHGDTLSTLFGMLIAKRAGMKVAHIESGLRSHSWLNPFPEEIIRILCMRYSDYLYAPSITAFNNIMNMRLHYRAVLIEGNTIIDSLNIALDKIAAKDKNPYILATCHRYETISNKKRLTAIIDLFNELAETTPITFVVHNPTLRYLDKFNLIGLLNKNISITPMKDYFSFISSLANARFVLTDGGSIQEECAYINKPCLILRTHTERDDGLSHNALLWDLNNHQAIAFFHEKKLTHQSRPTINSKLSPSKEIIDDLLAKINESTT